MQKACTLKVYSWKPGAGLNFGDHIGPLIVERMLKIRGLTADVVPVSSGDGKLLSVGSILQEARNGDYVWGAGVNGKTWLRSDIGRLNIKVYAVRGPISCEALRDLGCAAPEVFGDPGLLFPILYANEIAAERLRVQEFRREFDLPPIATLFVPNINDERFYFPEAKTIPPEWTVISPRNEPVHVAAHISLAERVVSSSLHGLVFADVYHKPSVFFQSRFEPTLKYDDYFLGTGRGAVSPVSSIDEVDSMTEIPKMTYSVEALADAFPFSTAEQLKEFVLVPTSDQLPTRAGAPIINGLQFSDNGVEWLLNLESLNYDDGWFLPKLVASETKRVWMKQLGKFTVPPAIAGNVRSIFLSGPKLADVTYTKTLRVSVNEAMTPANITLDPNSGDWKIVINLGDNTDRTRGLRVRINAGGERHARQVFVKSTHSDENLSLVVRKIAFRKIG